MTKIQKKEKVNWRLTSSPCCINCIHSGYKWPMHQVVMGNGAIKCKKYKFKTKRSAICDSYEGKSTYYKNT